MVPVPDSSRPRPGRGAYSFLASYSGNDNYTAPAQGSCESFTVGKASPSLELVVDAAATGQQWSEKDPAGWKSDAAASLSGLGFGIIPTGSVTYRLYGNGGAWAVR